MKRKGLEIEYGITDLIPMVGRGRVRDSGG